MSVTRIAIVANDPKFPIVRGQLRPLVEAIQVAIPGRKYITTAYATPALDDNGDPSEAFVISESTTGAKFSDTCATIESAIASAVRLLNRKRVTRAKWRAAIERSLALQLEKGLPHPSLSHVSEPITRYEVQKVDALFAEYRETVNRGAFLAEVWSDLNRLESRALYQRIQQWEEIRYGA